MTMIRLADCPRSAEGKPIIPPGCTLEPISKGEQLKCKTNDQAKLSTHTAEQKNRWYVFNTFVDMSMRDLKPSERIVWIVIYRDVRQGTARVSQSHIAKRSGLTQSTVSKAINQLAKKGFLKIVRQGSFRNGVSIYKIRGSLDDAVTA